MTSCSRFYPWMDETELSQLVAQDLSQGFFEPPDFNVECCCCSHFPDVRDSCDSGPGSAAKGQTAQPASEQPNEPIVTESTGRGEPAESTDRGTPARRFSKKVVAILNKWFIDHLPHPYPTMEQRDMLAQETGLTLDNVTQ